MSDLLGVHRQTPVRRVVALQTRYTLYREDLREDFVHACGYCDDDDSRADRSTFHIDHFAPKTTFPELELEYANLVYACRFCNVSKADHWIGSDAGVPNDGLQGFIDPCSDQYGIHLGRNDAGCIVAKTPLGAYIVKRLRLNLIRHELLWRARKARDLRDEIQRLIEEYRVRAKPLPQYATLLERFFELTTTIEDYELRAIPR